jgi:hypothetical protein
MFNLTFKLDIRMANKATDLFFRLVEGCRAIDPSNGFNILTVLQPLPKIIAQHSVARGGNMLGLERVKDDAMNVVAGVAFNTPELQEKGYALVKAAMDELQQYAVSIDCQVDFIYLNYADKSQDPLGSYGPDNLRKMREVAQKYDPTAVFQTRVPGGFKLSQVEIK